MKNLFFVVFHIFIVGSIAKPMRLFVGKVWELLRAFVSRAALKVGLAYIYISDEQVKFAKAGITGLTLLQTLERLE